MAQKDVLHNVVSTIFVLAAAGALSACVTGSRFMPGSTSEVPLDMALQAVKEERSIVYYAFENGDCSEALLLVEKNSGMTFKHNGQTFKAISVDMNELLEFLRREGRADHDLEASEFRTPDGKRVVAYVLPKSHLYAMTVDNKKNEFTISRIGCRRGRT